MWGYTTSNRIIYFGNSATQAKSVYEYSSSKIVSDSANPSLDSYIFLIFGIIIIIICHLADAFIQSDLQLIRLSRRHNSSCADLIVAAPGIEPPTLRVQVK